MLFLMQTLSESVYGAFFLTDVLNHHDMISNKRLHFFRARFPDLINGFPTFECFRTTFHYIDNVSLAIFVIDIPI